MVTPEIISYIRQQLAAGADIAALRQRLIGSGWQSPDIEAAFAQINPRFIALKVPVPPDNPIPTTPITNPAFSPQPVIGQTGTAVPGINNPAADHSGSFLFGIITGQRKFPVFLAGLILGILSCLQPTYQLYRYSLPYVDKLVGRVTDVVDTTISDKLEVKIHNGLASTNVDEPYFISISQNLFEDVMSFQNYDVPTVQSRQRLSKIRLLTLNTKGNIEDFDQFQSYAMLTAKNLVYYSNGKITVKSLGSVQDLTVSKKTILAKIGEFNAHNRVVNFLKIMIYSAPLLITAGFVIYFLVDILCGTLIAWIIVKILNVKIRFGSLYRFIGMLYAIPMVLLGLIKYLPIINIYYTWIDTVIDVIIISFVYVYISANRDIINRENP
jgi:hypothetical protein